MSHREPPTLEKAGRAVKKVAPLVTDKDGVRLPLNRMHRFWVRNGILIAVILLAVAAVLMVAGSVMSVKDGVDDVGDDLQRYALAAGLLAVVCYLDVLAQRIVTRLTQVVALFTTDVPPMQVRGRGSADAAEAPVIPLYRKWEPSFQEDEDGRQYQRGEAED